MNPLILSLAFSAGSHALGWFKTKRTKRTKRKARAKKSARRRSRARR